MSPPINIDGSEIQEATIDGQDVSEITIDGQQAADLSAIPDSVLAQDLVAWYRFEDGDARDYTATLDATFADTTAYDGAVRGATFDSSGGVTDFKSGANSGAFNFDGSDEIDIGNNGFSDPISVTGWFLRDNLGEPYLVNAYDRTDPGNFFTIVDPASSRIQVSFYANDGEAKVNNTSVPIGLNQYHHFGFTYDTASGLDVYADGQNIGGASNQGSWSQNANLYIAYANNGGRHWGGDIDDVRLYNTKLSGQEMQDIYNETEP
jgi:hypothetical protein